MFFFFFSISISRTPWWREDKLLHWCFEKKKDEEIGLKMWCNKYTENWTLTDERLKTLYRSLYLYIVLDCCCTVTPLREAQPRGCPPPEVRLEDTTDLFSVYEAGPAVISTCAKRKQPRWGHYLQKHLNKKLKNAQQLERTTEKNTVIIPTLLQEVSIFETLVLCSFNIHISVYACSS